MARKPQPRSMAALAMTANRKADRATKVGYLNTFVQDHLEPDRLGELLADMILSEGLPEDAVHRVARSIATWGTGRGYIAVVSLTLLTGSHWRMIRSHLITNGIADPMRLTSMHAVLDVTENLVLESMSSAKPQEAERKRRQFLRALYRPEAKQIEGPRPAPEGFDDDTMEAQFDAFAATAR